MKYDSVNDKCFDHSSIFLNLLIVFFYVLQPKQNGLDYLRGSEFLTKLVGGWWAV